MKNGRIGALAEDRSEIVLDGSDLSGFDHGVIARGKSRISAKRTKLSAPPPFEGWWRSYWVAVLSGITVLAVGGIFGLLWAA